MDRATSTKQTHFSSFLSASEEAEIKVERENWDNEGGHMSSVAGRVVLTPECDMPYKVVLTHNAGKWTERAFATMREAESFIRRNTPLPPARCTLFDRAADASLVSKYPKEVTP